MNTSQANSRQSDRIPRPALAVVAIGLLLSVSIFWISRSTGGSSAEVKWDVVEPVKTSKTVKLGRAGSLQLARTSLSAVAPNSEGYLIFQIAGVVRIDSGGKIPTALRCDVSTTSGPDSMIARTPQKRAAWPRPSEDLLRQEVPELAVVKFNATGTRNSGFPIRDAFRRYTDSAVPTLVDWDGYESRTQNWVWTMPEGAGDAGATLGYAAVFWTEERPSGEVDCRAKTAARTGRPAASASVRAPVRLKEWPIQDRGDTAAPGAGSQATDVK